MDYLALSQMQKNQSAWRLLQADNAPLIISFCQQVFIEDNRRSVPQAELDELLESHLYNIRQQHGPDIHPRPAKDYLDDWSKNDKAFLRKYYPRQSDEAEFDLTPSAENAIRFIASLQQRQFVGTESHLQAIFLQLQDLVMITEADPQVKIDELSRQRDAIDAQIAKLQQSDTLHYDETQVKERWYLLEENTSRLIADFRQVEENFRALDSQVREKIALSDASKGALLDEIFGDHDHIFDSDQGKSFKAFWSLLMSNQKQEQLDTWISKISQIELSQGSVQRDTLAKFQARLLEAGEKVHRTSLALAEQLRLYLDDNVWLENKRIVQLINQIERRAIKLKHDLPSDKQFMQLAGHRADVSLPLTRTLHRPENQVQLTEFDLTDGVSSASADALFNQHFVDSNLLNSQIRQALQHQPQVSLQQITELFPIEKGLSEILVYLNLASNSQNALINDQQQQKIQWKNSKQQTQIVNIPLVIFSRSKMDDSALS